MTSSTCYVHTLTSEAPACLCCAVVAMALINQCVCSCGQHSTLKHIKQQQLPPVAKGVLQGDLNLKGAPALHLSLGQGLAVGVQSSQAPGGWGPRHHPDLQAQAEESGPAVQCCSCRGAAQLRLRWVQPLHHLICRGEKDGHVVRMSPARVSAEGPAAQMAGNQAMMTGKEKQAGCRDAGLQHRRVAQAA